MVRQSGAATIMCCACTEKNGAVTMNIPVEQELEEGTRRWKKILVAIKFSSLSAPTKIDKSEFTILVAVFDELFVENLGSSVAKCVFAARC